MSQSKRLKQYYRGRVRNRRRSRNRKPKSLSDTESDCDPDRLGDAGLVIYSSRQTNRKSAANDSGTCQTLAATPEAGESAPTPRGVFAGRASGPLIFDCFLFVSTSAAA